MTLKMICASHGYDLSTSRQEIPDELSDEDAGDTLSAVPPSATPEGSFLVGRTIGEEGHITNWYVRPRNPPPAPASPSARFATPDAVAAELWRHLPRHHDIWKSVETHTAPPLWLYEAMDKALTLLPATPSSLTPDEREYLLSRVTSELADYSGDQRHMTKHEAERMELLRGLADKLRGGVAPVAAEVVRLTVAEVTEAATRYTKREGTDFIGRMDEAFGEIVGCLEGGEVPADMLEEYRSAASDLAALALAQTIMADEQIAALRAAGEAANGG